MSKNDYPVPNLSLIEFTANEIVGMCDYELAMYGTEVQAWDASDYERGFADGITWVRSLFSCFVEEKS